MPRLYCGTSGWNYKHWCGVFYPKNIPQYCWLGYYAGRFDTVEINNSFYRLPSVETFSDWRVQVPEEFIFAVKASRYLTHLKKLKDPEEPLDNVLSHSAELREKRGPILYQLPPKWHADLERLEHFLQLLPRDLRHVIEFRDNTWQREDVWAMLDRYSVGYCIMDGMGLPTHIKTTSDFSYVRMHSGENDGSYSDRQLQEWTDRVKDLLTRGDVYVYFNNDYMGYAVENALDLKKMVEEK